MSLFSILQVNQLLKVLQNSFIESDQINNWKILMIMVHILDNEKAFNLLYDQSILEFVYNFLSPSSDIKCIIQALFLLNIIIERTNSDIPIEKVSFLLSLLTNPSFHSYLNQVIIMIINLFDIDIPIDVAQKIYETVRILLINEDPSIKSLSLRLIQKIVQKYKFSIPNDHMELYYNYVSSANIGLAIDGLNFFMIYTENPDNIDQIIEFNLIEKLLQIFLFQNYKVCKFVFRILEIISKQSKIGLEQIYNNVRIADFFSAPILIQKSILSIMNELSKHKIIFSLHQISDEAFDFVITLLNSDDEEILNCSLNLITIFQSDFSDLFETELIDLLESLSTHSNEKIAMTSNYLLDSINERLSQT